MNFNSLCEKYLQDLGDEIEKKDIDSNLEIDYSDGILTIVIIANLRNNKNSALANQMSVNIKT